ncbi:hypothetical protein KU891_28875 (plasmid) [Bacillus tropicus]|uniref:hypothetical protein n=1 Tax=Bacillus tropicus TaxID=2026188 RepID=UPI002005238E|nr:hypothetical protein [Bacillus tropicus]UOK49504.1 hypothetical protein KU891_28875 [Bacillus tropicus]
MSNYNTIRTIISQISGQENIVVVPKLFIKLTGDLTTAVLLNQIVFYSDKSKRTDGYFYKSHKEWQEEICLTKRQVSYSTAKLKEMGLVDTKLMKANGAPTLHYKLDYDKLVDWIVTNCNNGKSQNVTMDSNNMSQSLTENTTETTTKKKTSCQKFSTSDLENAKLLFELMLLNNPSAKEPNFDKWANDFRLMREKDNRTDEQIKYLINWTQKDDFWSTNILSPAKLRKQFDALVVKIKKEKAKTQPKVVKGKKELREEDFDLE